MSAYDGAARPARPKPAPAWPGLLISLVAPLALTFGLFWLRASLPDTNFGRSADDALVRYWVKVIVLCVGLGVAFWAALWFGFVARTGRDIGATLFGVVLVATAAGAGGAIRLKEQAQAGPREVARLEQQWLATQDRDVDTLIGEVNAMRLSEVINPRSIAKHADFAEQASRLARARAALEARRRWREERIADYRARLGRVHTDAASRALLLAAFDRQRLHTEVITQEFLDAYENALLETEALAKFLHKNRARWRLEGERAIFRSEADFNYFDRGVRHYEETFSDQAHLRWDLRGNPLLAHDRDLFPNTRPSPRHGFVLF